MLGIFASNTTQFGTNSRHPTLNVVAILLLRVYSGKIISLLLKLSWLSAPCMKVKMEKNNTRESFCGHESNEDKTVERNLACSGLKGNHPCLFYSSCLWGWKKRWEEEWETRRRSARQEGQGCEK